MQCHPDRGLKTFELALDQVLRHAFAAHRVTLQVDLILDVALGCRRPHPCSMSCLLRYKGPTAHDGERNDCCAHDAACSAGWVAGAPVAAVKPSETGVLSRRKLKRARVARCLSEGRA